jgi:hypothetical protein
MLDPGFSAIGIGRAFNASSTYDWYWTADFGSVIESPTPTPTPTNDPVGGISELVTPAPGSGETRSDVAWLALGSALAVLAVAGFRLQRRR